MKHLLKYKLILLLNLVAPLLMKASENEWWWL